MDILLAKTPKDDVRDHVLPMVCKALETPAEQLQVLTIILHFHMSFLIYAVLEKCMYEISFLQ